MMPPVTFIQDMIGHMTVIVYAITNRLPVISNAIQRPTKTEKLHEGLPKEGKRYG
jgi:hypothetical protein